MAFHRALHGEVYAREVTVAPAAEQSQIARLEIFGKKGRRVFPSRERVNVVRRQPEIQSVPTPVRGFLTDKHKQVGELAGHPGENLHAFSAILLEIVAVTENRNTAFRFGAPHHFE